MFPATSSFPKKSNSNLSFNIPQGGLQFQSTSIDQIYYYNPHNNTAQWTPFNLDKTEVTLPPGWKSKQSQKGNYYFYNPITRQTQWQLPPPIESNNHEKIIIEIIYRLLSIDILNSKNLNLQFSKQLWTPIISMLMDFDTEWKKTHMIHLLIKNLKSHTPIPDNILSFYKVKNRFKLGKDYNENFIKLYENSTDLITRGKDFDLAEYEYNPYANYLWYLHDDNKIINLLTYTTKPLFKTTEIVTYSSIPEYDTILIQNFINVFTQNDDSVYLATDAREFYTQIYVGFNPPQIRDTNTVIWQR